MAMNFVKKLPIPAEVKKMYPLSDRVVEIKKKRDAEIRDVFTGASDKFILIIGPCSADNEDAVLDYMNRLAKVQEKVKDRIFIIADSSSSDKAVNALLKVGRKTAGAILLEPRLQGKAAVTVDRHGAELLVVTEEQSADAFGLITDYMEERGAFK